MRIVYILLGFVVISGCQRVKTPEPLYTDLLEKQQLQLTQQSRRIAELDESQKRLGSQMNLVALRLDELITTVNRNTKKTQQIKPKVQEEIKTERFSDELLVLGRVEWLWVDAVKDYLKARVDTGAATSSLHAKNIQPFERDGADWIKFEIDVDDRQWELEAPLVKYKKVKQASNASWDKRPVVTMTVSIDGYIEESQFTLVDRSSMIYPILLGRSFLTDLAIVDVSKKFIHKRKTTAVTNADQ